MAEIDFEQEFLVNPEEDLEEAIRHSLIYEEEAEILRSSINNEENNEINEALCLSLIEEEKEEIHRSLIKSEEEDEINKAICLSLIDEEESFYCLLNSNNNSNNNVAHCNILID